METDKVVDAVVDLAAMGLVVNMAGKVIKPIKIPTQKKYHQHHHIKNTKIKW